MRFRSRPVAIALSALTCGVLLTWLARAAASPAVWIQVLPPNPVAGQTAVLRDRSTAAPASGGWWDFGDGESSEAAAPAHAWKSAGPYTVRRTSGGETAESQVIVSSPDTLRLFRAHPFEIRVEADHPRLGRVAGRAVAVDDSSGWFVFPDADGGTRTPDIAVKVVEARKNGRYGIVWSGMTSLEYTILIREVESGRVAVHRKEGRELSGGADMDSFALSGASAEAGSSSQRQVVGGPERPSPRAVPPRGATAAPTGGAGTGTPTFTPSETRTPFLTRTPTLTTTPSVTPTASSTPTITLTPTITPTPAPPFIALRAIQWQWNFCPSSDGFACPEVCPAPCGQEITLHVGRTYRIWAYNGDDPDVPESHSLSSITAIGLFGGDLPNGGSLPVQDITPMNPGDYPFNCTTFCGSQVGHDGMVGIIHVVP